MPGPSSDAPVVPPTISRYRILGKLGAGGMGEVYLAEDTTLDRRVALKLLPQQHTRDAERLRRFKQEARAASALNHPNILTIHEVGEADGHHFIATEHVEGETLRAALARTGGMAAGEALDLAVQVASALAAAHEAGIVHRDVKPENVMIRRDGYAKVLDFGLAKLTETLLPAAGDASSPTAALPVHTGTGVVLGTAQYMSPEQATGRKVDARSDIFSFGAVLYEMVSGERVFQAASPAETMAAILNQEPKALPARVPPDLARVIQRCLRKDPERRYQTMVDLKAALQDLREAARSGRAARLSPPRRRAWVLWPALAAAAGLLGVAAWRAWRPAPDPGPLRAAALTTLPGRELHPSLSPDGDHVAFTWSGPTQDNPDVYVQRIGTGSPLRLTTDPRHDYNPVWSPDGRWIAFLRSQPPATTGPRTRELRLVAPLGGPERKLAQVTSQDFAAGLPGDAAYLAWAADGQSLVVSDSPGEGQPDALYAVSLETGEKRQLTHPRSPTLADTSPAVSPDGRSLAFLRRTTWSSGELHRLPLEPGMVPGGEPRRLTPAQMGADYPAWMPAGDEIVFSAAGGLWRVDAAGGAAPARVPYVGEDGSMPAISRPRSGGPARLVYVRGSADSNIWRVEVSAAGAPASSPPVKLVSSTTPEGHCRFSPDGRRLAFYSGRSGSDEIWVSDPDGSNAVLLTSLGARDATWPSWSPDGRTIAFSSTLEGAFDVYVVPAEGGRPRRLTQHPAVDIAPTFSRDGRWIYFASLRTGDYRVWKMPAMGGDAVQVTAIQGRGASESPDGRDLYFHAVSIEAPLWRQPLSGGEPVKVLEGIVWYNYCLAGGGAYYIDRHEGETRLRYLDLGSGRSTTVAGNLGEVSAGLTVSPDGRTILFTRVDSSADDLVLVEDFR